MGHHTRHCIRGGATRCRNRTERVGGTVHNAVDDHGRTRLVDLERARLDAWRHIAGVVGHAAGSNFYVRPLGIAGARDGRLRSVGQPRRRIRGGKGRGDVGGIPAIVAIRQCWSRAGVIQGRRRSITFDGDAGRTGGATRAGRGAGVTRLYLIGSDVLIDAVGLLQRGGRRGFRQRPAQRDVALEPAVAAVRRGRVEQVGDGRRRRINDSVRHRRARCEAAVVCITAAGLLQTDPVGRPRAGNGTERGREARAAVLRIFDRARGCGHRALGIGSTRGNTGHRDHRRRVRRRGHIHGERRSSQKECAATVVGGLVDGDRRSSGPDRSHGQRRCIAAGSKRDRGRADARHRRIARGDGHDQRGASRQIAAVLAVTVPRLNVKLRSAVRSAQDQRHNFGNCIDRRIQQVGNVIEGRGNRC